MLGKAQGVRRKAIDVGAVANLVRPAYFGKLPTIALASGLAIGQFVGREGTRPRLRFEQHAAADRRISFGHVVNAGDQRPGGVDLAHADVR